MEWKILHISVPVKDIARSILFYSMIIDITNDENTSHKVFFENNNDRFWGANGFGFRIFKPKPDLLIKNNLQSRRSYLSILIEDISVLKSNLDNSDYKFIYREIQQTKILLVQEPSLNLIQFVESDTLFNQENDAYNSGLEWGIHHMNIESLDVRETAEFFIHFAGMREGKWIPPAEMGNFSIEPNELSVFPVSNDNRGLHIIKPDDAFGYRNNFPHNPSIAGHPAFTVPNIASVMERLEQEGILYSDAKVYAMPGFHQIYLYDINANMIEINQSV